MTIRIFGQLVKRAAAGWSANNAPAYGAAIAFYTIFSFPPMLLVAINMASWVVGEESAQRKVHAQVQQTLGYSIADGGMDLLSSASSSEHGTRLSLFGLALLLFGASGVFAQLQEAFNLIWKTEPPPRIGGIVAHFIKHRMLSFVAVIGTGFLLIALLVANSWLAYLSQSVTSFPWSWMVWQGLATVLSFAFVTLLFTLIFKLLPDLPLRWRDVWVGALLTAVFFTIGQQCIGFYLGQANLGSAYGAAGSLVVFLAWVYYSAQIVLFGAEFANAYSEFHGLKPESLQTGSR